jgi:hypothetical protein
LLYGALAAKLASGREVSARPLDVCELTRRLVSGDVVEPGDTLVLETSAVMHESSTLSIPTNCIFEGDVAELG